MNFAWIAIKKDKQDLRLQNEQKRVYMNKWEKFNRKTEIQKE